MINRIWGINQQDFICKSSAELYGREQAKIKIKYISQPGSEPVTIGLLAGHLARAGVSKRVALHCMKLIMVIYVFQ